jgi:hypothetical protein
MALGGYLPALALQEAFFCHTRIVSEIHSRRLGDDRKLRSRIWQASAFVRGLRAWRSLATTWEQNAP